VVRVPSGTAYQRWYSDGLFHGTDGHVCDFQSLFHHNGGGRPVDVYLIYVPEDETPDETAAVTE
jgi:hypothetical protein